MNIEEIQINGFGNLNNKNIKLDKNLNIIYGKNEAGKSTLLRFIIAMFYGISKNKNGGNMPEIDKYTPWNNSEFSGKLTYRLDNNERIEIFREFNKKNPKIYNEQLEDISKLFNIDKSKGNQFFIDQTGVDEELIKSTIIMEQQNVKISEKEKASLIQKISNILGTGEDDISYNSTINKLKKKMIDEVGTYNTKERPLNIVNSKIIDLQEQIDKMEKQKQQIDEKEEELKYKNEELEDLKCKESKIIEANKQLEDLNFIKNKIQINSETINNNNKDIESIKQEIEETIKKNKTKSSKLKIGLNILIVALTLIMQILVQTILYRIISLIPICLYILINTHIRNNKNRNKNRILKKLKSKIEIIEENNNECIKKQKKDTEEYNAKINKIKLQYDIKESEKLNDKLKNLQEARSLIMMNIGNLNAQIENYANSSEKLILLREQLDNLKEQKEELLLKYNQIKLAIEYVNMAYEFMKEQVTPKFTKDLSDTIQHITNNKYNNVRLNTKGEILVENANGEYINAEQLSIGTIDQLYLSLRLGAISNFTKQNMPIILDETFAYFDEERLENILKYLVNRYQNKQIIIFTCTNREKNLLDKINTEYNYIKV